MRTVKMYHLIGVVAVFFMTVAVNLKAKDSVLIAIAFGVIVVLLLGIHLILDRQDNSIEHMERKIEQIASDVYETKTSSDFQSGMRINEQVAVVSSLESINRMLNEIKMKQKEMSLEEINKALEDISKKIEKISVK